MDIIKLFRGDFGKVAEFKVKETSKNSLLGEGIYLTDSTKVATTYRKKSDSVKLLELTYNRADAKIEPFNRIGALDAAFGEWLGKRYPDQVGYWASFRTPPKELSKRMTALKNEHRNVWQEMIDSRRIVVSYLNKDAIMVEEKTSSTLGYVSVFEFFSEEFESSVLKVDGEIKDQGFVDFVHSEKLLTSTIRQMDAVRSMNFDPYAANLHIPTRAYCHVRGPLREKMRKYLKQRGFKGMEYSGGILVGGYGMHRAFCIWDDAWVNYHKTNRYK